MAAIYRNSEQLASRPGFEFGLGMAVVLSLSGTWHHRLRLPLGVLAWGLNRGMLVFKLLFKGHGDLMTPQTGMPSRDVK